MSSLNHSVYLINDICFQSGANFLFCSFWSSVYMFPDELISSQFSQNRFLNPPQLFHSLVVIKSLSRSASSFSFHCIASSLMFCRVSEIKTLSLMICFRFIFWYNSRSMMKALALECFPLNSGMWPSVLDTLSSAMGSVMGSGLGSGLGGSGGVFSSSSGLTGGGVGGSTISGSDLGLKGSSSLSVVPSKGLKAEYSLWSLESASCWTGSSSLGSDSNSLCSRKPKTPFGSITDCFSVASGLYCGLRSSGSSSGPPGK